MHTLTMKPRPSLGGDARSATEILRLPDGRRYRLTRWDHRTFINPEPVVIALYALEQGPEIDLDWGDLVEVEGDQYTVAAPTRPVRHYAEVVPVAEPGEHLFRVYPAGIGATYVVAGEDIMVAMRRAFPTFDFARPFDGVEGRYLAFSGGKSVGSILVETPAAVTA